MKSIKKKRKEKKRERERGGRERKMFYPLSVEKKKKYHKYKLSETGFNSSHLKNTFFSNKFLKKYGNM